MPPTLTKTMRRAALAAVCACALLHAHAEPTADFAPNCVILPDQVVDVSGALPGVLDEVTVVRGERVRAGQVIARLEASVEEAAAELAQARASATAELRLREVELNYDEQRRERLQTLQKRHVASSQTLDDAARMADAAHWQLQLAEERRLEAALSKRQALAVLDLKTIRSPIDGVVVKRHRSVGEHVEAEPIVRVARLDPLRVEVLTPAAMFGQVQPEMRMTLRTELDETREHVARVVAVDPMIDPGSGMFSVQLSLPNPGNALPAGVKCYSDLTLAPADVTEADAAAVEAAAKTPPQLAEPLVADDAPDAACSVLTTLADDAAAQDIVQAVRELGGRVFREASRMPIDNGFVVVSPASDAATLSAWKATLEQGGQRDIAVLGRGDFAGRLALGVYNGPRSAERRRAQIEALGVTAEVRPRVRQVSGWRLEIALPSGADDASDHAAISDILARFDAVDVRCAQARAASLYEAR